MNQHVVVVLTIKEAETLRHAASAATADDGINSLGWDPGEKRAYNSAHAKLTRRIKVAKESGYAV